MKKSLFLSLLLFGICANSSAKGSMTNTFNSPSEANCGVGEVRNEDDDFENNTIFTVADIEPTFVGGQSALQEYFFWNLQYPEAAVQRSIRGKVTVSFIVEKDGTTNDVKVLRSPSNLLDAEAIRLVEEMPNWNPGKMRGNTVRVLTMLGINFDPDEIPTRNRALKKLQKTNGAIPIPAVKRPARNNSLTEFDVKKMTSDQKTLYHEITEQLLIPSGGSDDAYELPDIVAGRNKWIDPHFSYKSSHNEISFIGKNNVLKEAKMIIDRDTHKIKTIDFAYTNGDTGNYSLENWQWNVSLASGDSYIEDLPEFDSFIGLLFKCFPEVMPYDGVLTKADGSKIEYVRGIDKRDLKPVKKQSVKGKEMTGKEVLEGLIVIGGQLYENKQKREEEKRRQEEWKAYQEFLKTRRKQ